jgi:titin
VDAPNNSIGGPNAGNGNVILGNAFDGIRIAGLSAIGNMIQGNSIGADATNLTVKGNSVNGVEIAGAALNTVASNFILGNGLDGVNIYGGGATGNVVRANHIGINQTAATILGNHLNGVDVHDGASANTITGNLIGANAFNGVLIFGPNATGNVVQGNLIGTDATGVLAIGNGTNGVAISGISGNTISGNTIAANGGQGVLLTGGGASGNLVQSNLIGTDVTGTLSTDANGNFLGNASAGVSLQSGATANTIGGSAALGNVISNNGTDGVFISGTSSTGNIVQGNFIGTDVTGKLPLGNLRSGVHLFGASDNLIGGAALGTGNLISANGASGVDIENPATQMNAYPAPNLPVVIPSGGQVASAVMVANADLVTHVAVELNIQHLNVEDLSITLTAPDGTVVPLVAANVVPINSVNYTQSVFDDEAGTAIGNGTAPFTGSFQPVGPLSVLDYRVLSGSWILTVTSNGAHPVAGQLLSWSLQLTTARGNPVEGNLIGTDATGLAALGNAADGILIKDALRNTIGGTMPGQGNTIAFNGSTGASVTGATSRGNSILGNAIFANTALGIDLGADGVTLNDATNPDTGPNSRQNYPVLSLAISSADWTTVTGTLHSAPGTNFRIEFFSNPTADPSGHGQGSVFLGAALTMTDANGDADFMPTLPVPVPVGQFITATATNVATGDTSEFAQALVVTPQKASPVFSALTSPSIVYGTTTTTLRGHLAAGALSPPANELVAVTLNGVTHLAPLDVSGNFHTTFATAALGVAGSAYTIRYGYAGDNTFNSALDTSTTLTVTKATPTFSGLSSSTIVVGTASTLLTGTLSAPRAVPAGATITLTLNGVNSTAIVQADGTFSASLPTATLPVGSYTLSYQYAGSADYSAARGSGTVQVTYGIAAQFSPSQPVNPGATLPILLLLTDAAGNKLSSAALTVHADYLVRIGDPSQTHLAVQAPGNSQPGNNFKYTSGEEQFNLKTSTSMAAGAYELFFSIAGDPIEHFVTFVVR